MTLDLYENTDGNFGADQEDTTPNVRPVMKFGFSRGLAGPNTD